MKALINILLTIICTLISGCGLFKKTTKVEDSQSNKLEIAQARISSTEAEEKSKKEANILDKSNERTIFDIDSNTSIEADELEVTGNSIKAKGNVKYNSNLIDKSQKERNADLTSSEKVESDNKYSNKTKDENKQEIKQESKHLEKVSEPSGKGIVLGAIGILIIVLGICFYFGLSPKK